jgi:phosphatidylglycerol lysyltransferase
MSAYMPDKIVGMPYITTDRVRRAIRYSIGCIIGVEGLADMVSAIAPKNEWIMQLGVWPSAMHRTQINAQNLTVVVGFFLIMLSYGLMRGKRHAWLITMILLLVSAIFLHVLRGGSVLATVIALLLAAVLGALYHFFQAKSDPPSVRQGYVALALGLGIVMFYTIGGFLALYNDFEAFFDRFGFEGVLLRILIREHFHFSYATPAFFFAKALPLLSISAVLYGMIKLFRPVAAAVLHPCLEERQRISGMVRLYGKNSISYFALDNDKSYFFSTSGKIIISYVLQGSTAVVAGDPIGPEGELPVAIKEFITFCQQQDWTIVFWQVRAELTHLYRTMGLHLLKIGEDAVINTSNFTLKGGAMANVRTSAKRAEKEGLRAVFYHGSITDAEQLAQVEHISHVWLARKGGTEMGFSMGHFDAQGDDKQLYALAVDAANKVHAFVSFVPIYGRHGWGLDLMRRAEPCAPGTMELLLARSIEYMKGTGFEMVSLGLAPLSNVNKDDDTFLGSRINFLTERFGTPDKGRSLFSFKKKFQPAWESRFLVYSDTLSLPKIGCALYYAHQRNTSLLRTIHRSVIEWRRSKQEQSLSLEPKRTTTGALETLKV